MRNKLMMLILFIVSCNVVDKERQTLSKLVADETILAKYSSFIVVSKIQCRECVKSKLLDFINNSSEAKTVLFILDTANNNTFDYINKKCNYIHRKQSDIEELYPYISNFNALLFNGNATLRKDFNNTNDTTSVVSFLKHKETL